MQFTKTQPKITTAKLHRTIYLSLRSFLAAMIFFWYAVSVYISVSAQNLTPEIFLKNEKNTPLLTVIWLN